MNDSFWNQLREGAEERFSGFGHLMPFRVQEILLVASMYDAFTLEEGGRLTELLLSEYRELNLSFAPRITKASSGREAIELLEARRFDLVITMSRLGDLQAAELACNGRLGRLTHATCWVGPGPKFDIPDRAADVPPPMSEPLELASIPTVDKIVATVKGIL